MSFRSPMFAAKPRRPSLYLDSECRDRINLTTDIEKTVTIVRTSAEPPEYEVAIPGEESVTRFYAQDSSIIESKGQIPLYRDETILDHARSPQEAADRVYHEARKFAYSNANGYKVRDLHRELNLNSRIELK